MISLLKREQANAGSRSRDALAALDQHQTGILLFRIKVSQPSPSSGYDMTDVNSASLYFVFYKSNKRISMASEFLSKTVLL